jgi:heme/copper-type cytochrome/quinol oxidase subunit 2
LFPLQPGIKNFSQITTNSYFNNEINHFIRTNTYAKLLPIKLVFNDKHFIVKFQNNSLLNIEKNIIDNLYLVIKQKRFGLNKNISIFNGNYVHLNNLTQFKVTTFNQSNVKLLNLTNGSKNINFSNMHTRRLLRTRRVLVLPTNINVTLITNSFDVVHSWYIPGLGIKLDCIPGRSTHHTLYIDHAGFYYGQCAEICGRYHHHMPIRVCALPYEHFLM